MLRYTTKEQSLKLIELGLDPKTADGYYPSGNAGVPNVISLDKIPDDWFEHKTLLEDRIPAWSMEALLEAIPKYVHAYDADTLKSYSLNLFRSYYHCCSYSFGPSLKEKNHDNLVCFGCDTWLEAVYKTALWALENVENYFFKPKKA